MPNQEEQEALKPIGSEEELKDVRQMVQAATKIKSLTEHPGWTDVLMPNFDRQIDTLTKGLLTVDPKLSWKEQHIQIIRYQEAINGIKKIFGIINYYLNEGEVAEQRVEAFESAKKKDE